MHLRRLCFLAVLAGAACTEPPPGPAGSPANATRPLEESAAPEKPSSEAAAAGGIVYVPVYSHIYFRDQRRTLNLAATLSVRNTDVRESITIRSIRYHGERGQLIRHYVAQPQTLGPLASTGFVVDEEDTSGGLGASFMVEWSAQAPVADPVVEAVMISARSAQGVSFISVGRTLMRLPAPSSTRPPPVAP